MWPVNQETSFQLETWNLIRPHTHTHTHIHTGRLGGKFRPIKNKVVFVFVVVVVFHFFRKIRGLKVWLPDPPWLKSKRWDVLQPTLIPFSKYVHYHATRASIDWWVRKPGQNGLFGRNCQKMHCSILVCIWLLEIAWLHFVEAKSCNSQLKQCEKCTWRLRKSG